MAIGCLLRMSRLLKGALLAMFRPAVLYVSVIGIGTQGPPAMAGGLETQVDTKPMELLHGLRTGLRHLPFMK